MGEVFLLGSLSFMWQHALLIFPSGNIVRPTHNIGTSVGRSFLFFLTVEQQRMHGGGDCLFFFSSSSSGRGKRKKEPQFSWRTTLSSRKNYAHLLRSPLRL